MSLISSATEEGGENAAANPESIPLYLPSAVIAENELRVHPKVSDVERRLRIAQADDALSEIRRLRRIITGLWQFKSLQLSGEGNRPNTRLRVTHTRLQNCIMRAAERYRAARNALEHLDPNGPWAERLQVLENAHIKGPGRGDGESNSSYEISWIWLVPCPKGESKTDQMGAKDVAESMRVEWAKARARKLRWDEEYQLVQEEMRRTVAYLEWKAQWWQEQENRRSDTDDVVLRGISAYAHKQTAMLERLAHSCCEYWAPTLQSLGITIPSGWPKTTVASKGKAKDKAPAHKQAHEQDGGDKGDAGSDSGSETDSNSENDGSGNWESDVSDEEMDPSREEGGKQQGKSASDTLEYTAGIVDSDIEFDDFDFDL